MKVVCRATKGNVDLLSCAHVRERVARDCVCYGERTRMFAIIAGILMRVWMVGLSDDLIGGYANIFMLGAIAALLAHYFGGSGRAARTNFGSEGSRGRRARTF